MEIERVFEGNEVGIRIRRPKELDKKWEIKFMILECSNCGSTNIKSGTNDAGFCVACLDCPNHDTGIVERILTHQKSGKAIVNTPENFDRIDYIHTNIR